MSCSPLSSTAEFAGALLTGLRAELDLTPKPGLVDRHDSGSHEDLDHALMVRSIRLLGVYFDGCVAALDEGQPIERLRELGVVAEQRMFSQLGSNTHRGVIFLGGVLLAAVHASDSRDAATVSDAVAAVAQRLFASRLPVHTKGSRVRAHYGVGGIVGEALDGLPALFSVAVPALRLAGQRGWRQRDGLFLAMARLMQTVEDTTALRRCGPAGLARLRRDGERLETLLMNGVDAVGFLRSANQHYQAMRLTMGGVADLLAMAVAWRQYSETQRGESVRVEQVIRRTPHRCLASVRPAHPGIADI